MAFQNLIYLFCAPSFQNLSEILIYIRMLHIISGQEDTLKKGCTQFKVILNGYINVLVTNI